MRNGGTKRVLAVAAVIAILAIAGAGIVIVLTSKHPKDVAPVVASIVAVISLLAALLPLLWEKLSQRPRPVDESDELIAAADILARRAEPVKSIETLAW